MHACAATARPARPEEPKEFPQSPTSLVMGWSASAIATLVGLCVIAPPLAYAGDVLKRRLKRRRGRKGARLGEGAGGARAVAAEADQSREVVRSSEYLLSLLGYAIGIGNVWRFPWLVGKYGGAAFVLAYVVSLVFVAMPLYLMTCSDGHNCSPWDAKLQSPR